MLNIISENMHFLRIDRIFKKLVCFQLENDAKKWSENEKIQKK